MRLRTTRTQRCEPAEGVGWWWGKNVIIRVSMFYYGGYNVLYASTRTLSRINTTRLIVVLRR
nr:MAG TPA: hypothetical protein [Caudoviricetes sp.]